MTEFTCPELSLDEWGEGVLARLKGRRYPLRCTFELTERCNLACVHCYIRQPPGSATSALSELNIRQIAGLLDQVAEAGCIALLLTGGEVLLREDLPEIHRHAKEKGMLVSLFTNGTLLTPITADFFAEWPPSSLEITLYGATESTYEAVTRVPGSFRRCMAAIEMLLERGLRLNLKSVLLKDNHHELAQMRGLAARLGVPFRYDGMIWPRLDGSGQPYAHRLPAREVADLDLDDPGRLAEWQELCRRAEGFSRSESLFECGAGVNGFHIDSTGSMSVCMMARRPAYDLLNGSFQEGWQSFVPLLRRKRTLETPCRGCTAGVLCAQCPGWSQMVHGDYETPVEFVCQVGHLRARHLAVKSS